MKLVPLGTSGIQVSPLCLGCMSFGDPASKMHQWTLNPEETDAIVARALEHGINFFDTANVYSAGTSEEYLAKALNKHITRDKVVIATKVYFNEGHLSREAIQREIEGSLRRLKTDYVDLYIIHRFDYDTPMEETMETLHRLVLSGKVRALGASAMYGYQFHNLQEIAARNGWTQFVSMQNHYNLLYREDEREMIPICKQYGVSLTPYSPLAAGRLARINWESDSVRSQTDKVAMGKYDTTKDTDAEIARRVYEVAQHHGVTMTQVALAWHWAAGVTSPIVGATKMKYVDDAVGALHVQLTEDEIAWLEEPYVPHKIMGAI